MTMHTLPLKAPLLVLAILIGIAVQCGQVQAAENKTAYFAGGCFWCVESDFESVTGVSEVVSGYTGGRTSNPTWPLPRSIARSYHPKTGQP